MEMNYFNLNRDHLDVYDDLEESDVVYDELESYVAMNEQGLLTDEMAVSILKKKTETVFKNLIRGLYDIIEYHPVQAADQLKAVNTEKELETVRDYHARISAMKNAAIRLSKKIEQVGNDVLQIPNDYIESLDDFIGFTSSSESISKAMVDVIDDGTKKSDAAYCKSLKRSLNYIDYHLTNAADSILSWDRYSKDGDYSACFDAANEYYEACSELIRGLVDEYFESVSEKKNSDGPYVVAPEQKRIFKVQDDGKINDRLAAIKTANEMFDRFQVDFMRDLQKEVSLMNRDMYNNLIDKVETFLKKFPMPLSNDVSIGMAEEAAAQISKFIESVYEISKNTYTPFVFEKQ